MTGAEERAGRAGRPRSLPPRSYRFPGFERRRLDNGMQLIVAPARKLPLATVSVVTDAGAVADAPGREGIAQLTAELLLEGTANDTGALLAEKFERLGAAVDAETDWDVSVVSLTALHEHLERAIRLLGDVLRVPSFPLREVERLKAERRAELLRLRTEPRGLADDMFARVLYSGASRFSRPVGGTETSVAAITQADVRRFYEDRYRAAGVTLVVAGDIEADEAERLARAAFDDWSGSAPAPVATLDTAARTDRAIHIVSKPDAQQTELRVGHIGLPRGHPDYYAAVVMNAVLGGLFSSRINLNLREAHGYTYGAYSRLEWRRQAGPFLVSTAVQTEVTARAAREVITEIDRIRSSEIADDELSLATSYLDGLFPIRYETTDSIAGALVNLTTFGLPDDFHDHYRERVRATTTGDVLRAAQTHLRPQALQMLVVGDASKVRGQLEALEFGPATLYDQANELA